MTDKQDNQAAALPVKLAAKPWKLVSLLILTISLAAAAVFLYQNKSTEPRRRATGPDNLIQNGSFSSIATHPLEVNYGVGWIRNGADRFSPIMTEDGNKYLYMFSLANSPGWWMRYEQPVNITQTGNYTLTVKARALLKHGRGVSAILACGQSQCGDLDVNDPVPGSTISFDQSNDWETKTVTFNVAAAANYIVRLFTEDGSQAFWDDVSLAPAGGTVGGKIVFTSNRDGNYEIYVMNADGSGVPTKLTNNSANDYYPSSSRDGQKIAFTSNRDGDYEIYVMNADGTDQTNLTNNLTNEHLPSFSPDGQKIVFFSERDGNREIYIMNADGLGVWTRLTNNPADDHGFSFFETGDNLIQNGGFSTTATHPLEVNYGVGWIRGGADGTDADRFSPIMTEDEDEADNGNKYLYMFSLANSPGWWMRYEQPVNIAQTGNYTLTVKAKVLLKHGRGVSAVLACGQSQCGELDVNDPVPGSTISFDQSNDWETKTATFDVAAAANYIVRLFTEDGSQAFWDDVSLVQVISPPLPAYKVFNSSTQYNGNLGGLTGADAECQARAGAASLTGTFRAWLSTSAIDAKDRIPDARYVLVDGTTTVANNKADLIDGSIQNKIDKNEFGNTVSNSYTWTGTLQNGTEDSNNCDNWTNSTVSYSGVMGSRFQSDARWTNDGYRRCNAFDYSLFCFQTSAPPSPTPTVPPTPTLTLTPTPPACLPDGQICAIDNDCCSGYCGVGECPPGQDCPDSLVCLPSGRLSFKIRLQGIIAAANDRLIHIDLKQGNLDFIIPLDIEFQTDAAGVYSATIDRLDEMIPGTYDILFKGPSHLRKKFTDIEYAGGAAVFDFSQNADDELWAGDVTGDNVINLLDFDAVLDNYIFPEAPAGDDEPTDINADGKISINDIALSLLHINIASWVEGDN